MKDYASTDQMTELAIQQSHSKRRYLWQRVCLSLAFLSAPLVALLVAGVYWLWDTHSPVLRDFRVNEQIEVVYNGQAAYYVMGSMDKVRDCRMTGLSAVTPDGTVRHVSAPSVPAGFDSARPVGPQRWGPWLITAERGQAVVLHGRYTCNGVWTFLVRLTGFVVGEKQ